MMPGPHDVVSIGYKKVWKQDLLLPDALELWTKRCASVNVVPMSVKCPYLTWRRNCSGPDLRDTVCVHGSGLARSHGHKRAWHAWSALSHGLERYNFFGRGRAETCVTRCAREIFQICQTLANVAAIWWWSRHVMRSKMLLWFAVLSSDTCRNTMVACWERRCWTYLLLQLGNEIVHVFIILVSYSMYQCVQFVLRRFKNHVIVRGAHVNNAWKSHCFQTYNNNYVLQ